jgi:hypothetical protein
MKSVVAALVFLTLVAGAAMAAVPSTTDYLLATQPMISGTVISANDRQMVMRTDKGEQVTLAVDSRTMVPTDLGPGMIARVEFKVTEDGRYIARRVIPIREGVSRDRELAYARVHDQGMATASSSMSGGRRDHTMAAASMPGGAHESLPQTASPQPLVLLLGTLALGAAGALALARRLRLA